MRLTAELLAEAAPSTPPAPELTMEDRIVGEQLTNEAEIARQDLQKYSLQLESLKEAYAILESFQTLYDSSLEDEAGLASLEKPYRLTLETMFGKDFADEAEFSQEGIGNALKRIGQAIKNAGGRMHRAWKDFAAAVTGSWEKLEKRATAVERQLDNLDMDPTPENDEIKITGGSRLHIKGSLKPKDLAETYPQSLTALYTFARATTEFGRRFVDHVERVQKELYQFDPKTELEELRKLKRESVMEIDSHLQTYSNDVKEMNGTSLPGGHELKLTRTPTFYVERPGRDEALKNLNLINRNKFGTYKEKAKVDAPTPQEIRALLAAAKQSLTSMTKMVDDASAVMEDSWELARGSDVIPRIKKNMEFRGDESVGEVFGEIAGTMLFNYVGNRIEMWVDYINENLFDIYNYLFQTSRAVIEYCERGADNYK